MQKKTINRIRENIEKIEENTLAKYAIKSKNATRLYMENYKPCTRRTEFQRDKDRIIYSLAFKRLMEKTQVYMTNQGDHYTNRLSHTLEVTQISRSVASSLGLNQNLIEAISLGHDLGHTPFGHAVESILNKKLPEEGFAHNYQSVLVVDLLENKKFKNNETQNGINLTNYVRYGILHHTKPVKSINTYNRFNDNISVSRQYHSIESELVNKIDTLAYLYHDLEDAINNKNILQDMKLNNKTMFNDFIEELNFYTRESCKITDEKFEPIKDLWNDYNSNTILKAMIKDLIDGTSEEIENQKIESVEDVQNTKSEIAVYKHFKELANKFKEDFMKKYIYLSPIAVQMDTKAKFIANRLFESFNSDYMQLPYRTRQLYENVKNGLPYKNRMDSGYNITPDRVVANYIAGMTDRYAMEIYKRMFE